MDLIGAVYPDILLGLNGIPSSCIYQNKVLLSELLNPSEAAILERIVDVGKLYCEISQFIHEKNTNELRDGSVGSYMLTFVENLEKSLSPYRKSVMALESKAPSLTLLYSQIYPYWEVLRGLASLVREINVCEIRGVLVLHNLEKHLNDSTRGLKVALQFIYQGVSKLLLNHLQSWLLYGEINDYKKEFFIQRTLTIDQNSPFKNYSLCSTLLPSLIRPVLAEKILNIGQTVLYLRSRPGKTKESEIVVDFSGVSGMKADEIAEQLNKASQVDTYQQCKLVERAVDMVGTIVATQLHRHAMQDAHLVQQLHMIKDLFLMGRGELFHEFVRHASVTQVKSHGSLTYDYNSILHACARKVLINEETLQPFTLELVRKQCEGGAQFNIRYSVPWPLELIFTQEVVASYNYIFRFLLRLKRIQVKVADIWLKGKSKRQMTCVKRRQLLHNLWFLVNNLQYYLQVDVLDSQFVTLEAAIISSQDFDEIRRAHVRFLSNLIVQSFLDSPQDVTGVVSPVHQRLDNILKLCEEYCSETERNEEEDLPTNVVDSLMLKYDSCFDRLFSLLAALKKHSGHPCSQHLGQLLLRLDFNRFLSKKNT